MEFGKLNFNVGELKKMPKKERVFLIFCLIFLTDSNVNRKLMKEFLDKDKVSTDKNNKDANTQFIFNNLFALTGKIFDCWNLIDDRKIDSETKKVIGNFSNTWFFKKFYEDFSQEEKASLDQLINYFNGSNVIKKIRNKVSSHYDYKLLEKCSKKPEVSDFSFCFSRNQETEEAYFSNASMLIFSHFVFDRRRKRLFNKKDPTKKKLKIAMDDFCEEIFHTLRHLDNVIHGSLIRILKCYFPDKKMETLNIDSF